MFLPISPYDTSLRDKIASNIVSPAASPCGIDNTVIRHPAMDGLVFLKVECLDIIYLHDTNEVLANASAPLSTYLVRHDPVYLNQRDDGSLLVKQVVHPDAFLLQSEWRDGTGNIYKKEDFITLAECARDAVQMKHIHDLEGVYRLLPDKKSEVLPRLLTKLKDHWQRFEQDSQPTTRAFFSFLNGFKNGVNVIIDQSLGQIKTSDTQSSGGQADAMYKMPVPSAPPYSEVMGIDSTCNSVLDDGHHDQANSTKYSLFNRMLHMIKQAIQACRQWFRWLQFRFFNHADFQSLKTTEGKTKKGKIIDTVQ